MRSLRILLLTLRRCIRIAGHTSDLTESVYP